MTQKQDLYDVIVVGSGVAGCSVGMYSGRFQMKTLVLGSLPGGIITTTHLVENYPGIKSITGTDMGIVFIEHAKMFGADIKNETVVGIEKYASNGDEKSVFKIKTSSNEYCGKTVVIATGTEYKKLGAPGEEEFSSKGVSYCALCDGAFFKGKEVGLVGGGDAAAIDALILTEFASKVHVFVRKDFMRAEPVNLEKIQKSGKVEIHYKTEVAEIFGNGKVEGVKLKSGEKMKLDAVFMAIGHVPNSSLARSLGVELDDHGYVKVDVRSSTNVPGVFAAGDVTDKPFKQAIIGAAEGVMASYFAYQYLQNNEVAFG